VRREIKRYEGVVGLINDLEADMSTLSDEELQDKTGSSGSASASKAAISVTGSRSPPA